MTQTTTSTRPAGNAYRHEALFYDGERDFVRQTSGFIRDGVSSDQEVVVVVQGSKIDLLRSELGDDAAEVRFADMTEVGRNPARIIEAWKGYVDEASRSGRSLRGVGEPIWVGRTDDELVECERHEALLNIAVDPRTPLWLVCPYDIASLAPSVIGEARKNHPVLAEVGTRRDSPVYPGEARISQPFAKPLPPAPADHQEMPFGVEQLSALRSFVAANAARLGATGRRNQDLVFATNELAANSLRHAGGRGIVRIWRSGSSVVCEVQDDGVIGDPMVGRVRPEEGAGGGYGVWLANQLCELVQIRSVPGGSVVRLHKLTT
jgi:anti-sigma regulatory factor (Ser/Thr protein kinase)